MSKLHTIVVSSISRTSTREVTDTLENLKAHFAYTLECGKSYEHEKGNSKISLNPKTIKSLVNNLNNAKSNSAANGLSNTFYSLKEA